MVENTRRGLAELSSDRLHLFAAPPRDGSKQAKLVSMLLRKSGISLVKASEALCWQTHTTSAAMTGLRKRGYQIDRTARDGKDSIYHITTATEAAE